MGYNFSFFKIYCITALIILSCATISAQQDTTRKDSLVEVVFPDGEMISSSNFGDDVFTYVEQMPVFKGGQDSLYRFIARNIRYPAEARENGIQGRVVVQFVITKEGSLEDAKVVQKGGSGLDEEALRVIDLMRTGYWLPGKHNGRTVPVRFTLPISFKLESGN